MEAIYIPELLKLPEQREVTPVNQFLVDLQTLTPVRGQVQVAHQGNYLEVCAQAETIITLTCHRCLKQYNHRLTIDTSELVWLASSADQLSDESLEEEITWDDLQETLPAQGYFYPDTWLYEQLCLAIPPRQLCDQECIGIQINDNSEAQLRDQLRDQRWGALESLKRKLPG